MGTTTFVYAREINPVLLELINFCIIAQAIRATSVIFPCSAISSRCCAVGAVFVAVPQAITACRTRIAMWPTAFTLVRGASDPVLLVLIEFPVIAQALHMW